MFRTDTTTDQGAADTTVTEATDDKTSTDTAKADNGEVPTLIWWSIGGTPSDDFDKTIAEISDYTEEKIGVRIDVKIASWADWGTKMNNRPVERRYHQREGIRSSYLQGFFSDSVLDAG